MFAECCCLFCGAFRLLFNGGCLMTVVYCLLFVVWCLVVAVVCCKLYLIVDCWLCGAVCVLIYVC